MMMMMSKTMDGWMSELIDTHNIVIFLVCLSWATGHKGTHEAEAARQAGRQ